MGLVDPGSGLLLEFVEGASEWAREFVEGGKDSAHTGAQETVIDSGEEQGHAQAEVSKPVTMGAGDALDDLVESETAQVIGHLSGG